MGPNRGARNLFVIRRLLWSACACVVLGTTSISHADDPVPGSADLTMARDLFREGARQYQEGNWQLALDAYLRSMALHSSNVTRFSIAVVEERLNLCVEAAERLREFLRLAKDNDSAPYVLPAQDLLTSVEQRVGRIKIVVPNHPQGAVVTIDNEVVPAAALGAYRPVNPGSRTVILRVPAQPRKIETVVVEAGMPIEVRLQLLSSVRTPVSSAKPPVQIDNSKPSAANTWMARDFFRDGVRYSGEQKWARALDSYQRSMALRPSNVTRFSIAAVEGQLGLYVEAAIRLREFLRSTHDAESYRYVPAAQELLRDMEGRIGHVRIVIPEKLSVVVTIDDEVIPAAEIGVLRSVNPGTHKVMFRVPTLPERVRTIVVRSGTTTEARWELLPTAHTYSAKDSAKDSTAASPQVDYDDVPEASRTQNRWGWGLVAAGSGMVIIGSTTVAIAQISHDRLKKRQGVGEIENNNEATGTVMGIVGIAVGVTTAGVGTILLLWPTAKPDTSTHLQVTPWVGDRGGGFFASGQF